MGQLVYGRVTKLVPFGAFVQVGDGIEGLVHISEMSTHHVDSPEQVVTPGEELWVKIIDLDLARRRISLSIKQAAEGGELAEEYREHFEVDEHGNWASGDRMPSARPRGPSTTTSDGHRPTPTTWQLPTRPRPTTWPRRSSSSHLFARGATDGYQQDGTDLLVPIGCPHAPGMVTAMIVVGLTGGIGSGKSTVSAMLAARGAVVIDADRIVHEVQAPGKPMLDQLAAASARRSSPTTARSIGRVWPRSCSTTNARSTTSTPSSIRRCAP